jgi:hypothetical protein
MANDALAPGPLNNYPWFPRDSQGHPFWSDSELTDKVTVDEHGVDVKRAPMPRGYRMTRDPATGGWVKVDVTPRSGPTGTPINPPNI